jgi:hypothetical protein
MGSPSRYSRRAFIGLAAGAAAIPAVTAGCQSSGPSGTARPGARPSPSRRRTVQENALPGDPGWDIRHLGRPDAMMGYAGQASVLPGEQITLYASTTSRSFTVSAFRMGWYRGDLARLVWRSGTVPGHRQRKPGLIKPTNTVEARWGPSLSIATHDWPEGSYLLRMDSEDGPQRFVPVTVRSAKTAGKTVIKNSVETWQAYNMWGGHDLYNGPGGIADHNNRSLAVSRTGRTTGRAPPCSCTTSESSSAGRTPGMPLAYATSGHRGRPAPAGRGERAVLAGQRRVLDAAGAGARHRGQGRGCEHRVPRRELHVPADPAGQHAARPAAAGHLL